MDIEPQPDYPFTFIQQDVLHVLSSGIVANPRPSAMEGLVRDFDAIHASPPCQAYTTMNREHEQADARAAHPALIADIRGALEARGLPYVIENVVGAVKELKDPIQLCGRTLGLGVHRHRLFETNFPLMGVQCTGGRDPFGVYGKLDGRLLWKRSDGSELRAPKVLEEAQEAMGMDWSDWHGLKEAVPPAYTEHIGSYLLNHLSREKAAA